VEETEHIRWSRVLAFVGLTFLLLELASQVVIFAWAKEPYESLSLYRWSPYGLVRNNPNSTHPSFSINPQGFRNVRSFTRKKPKNTLRIILLGGSVLYSGIGGRTRLKKPELVNSESTIAQFLEARFRRDRSFAGLDFEVINAAVNFNRIVEVSTAYLAEWAFWDPDLVIVCGSANNFGYMPRAGAVDRGDLSLHNSHPWRLEFERLANQRSFLSAFENSWLSLEEHLASAAISRKVLSKGIDRALGLAGSFRPLSRQSASPVAAHPASTPWADRDEQDRYIEGYLGFAAAIVSAARQRSQSVAFFWEYFVAHLHGIRPFNEEEKRLHLGNTRSSSEIDRGFDFYARDRVREFCAKEGATFLDPMDAVIRTVPGTLFIDYLHYTKEGNAAFADFMYEELREELQKKATEIRAGTQR
jgi:hypothetical protein